MSLHQYLTITQLSEGIYKESGSKFLAFAFPLKSEEEAKEHIKQLRADHKGAVHFCSAYVFGMNKHIQKSSDDGEPAGSAGKPILNQILSSGLTNVLIVVVRYYGGVKLGIPGLIRAYKTATQSAIESAHKELQTPKVLLSLASNYASQGNVIRILKSLEADVLKVEPMENVTIHFEIPIHKKSELMSKLSDDFAQNRVWLLEE